MQSVHFPGRANHKHSRRGNAVLLGVSGAVAIGLLGRAAIAVDANNNAYWTNGGTSNWSTNSTDSNWSSSITGTTPLNPWVNLVNASGAVFNATGGSSTINVATPITVSSINFLTSGYDLTGSSAITFASGSSNLSGYGSFSTTSTASGGYSGIVNVAAGSAEIDTTINGVGLKKEGPGTLTLGGAFTPTGTGYFPLTGTLNYAAANGYNLSGAGISLTSNLAIGGTTISGSSTAPTTVGGTLVLGSGATLASNTAMSIGDGLVNMGSTNQNITSLTFTNPSISPARAWVPGTGSADGLVGGHATGIVGSGTLVLSGDINVLYTGFNTTTINTIAMNFNVGTGTQVCRIAGTASGQALVFSMPISGTGNLVEVGGLLASTGTGVTQSNTGTFTGGMGLFANNTYTGSTLFASGANLVAGSNATTSVTIANAATVQLLGSNEALGSATAINVTNGGTLALLDQTNIKPGFSSNLNVSAGSNNFRLNDSANVVLKNGSLIFQCANSSSGLTSSEKFGSLNASIGQNLLTISNTNGQLQLAQLTADSLNVGSKATLAISIPTPGDTLGADQFGNVFNQLLFNTAPTGDSNNGIIPRVAIDWIPDSALKAPSRDFATYDSTNGLVPFTNYSSTFDNNAVVQSSTGTAITAAGDTSKSIFALKMLSGSGSFTLAPNTTLNITSGMMLLSGTSAGFQVSGGATSTNKAAIDFGTATGVIMMPGANTSTISIYTAINGSGGLVISDHSTSASPTVTLGGDLHNLTGAITLNGGNLTLGEQLGAGNLFTGELDVRSGTLALWSTTAGAAIETTGLGDIVLGEPENAGNVSSTAVASLALPKLELTSNVAGTFTTTRNLVVNNGGTTDFGNALTAGQASSFSQLDFPGSTATRTVNFNGNVTLNSPLAITGSLGSTFGLGTNFNGNISGAAVVSFTSGSVNLNSNLLTTGPIWIGSPTFTATASNAAWVLFNGSAGNSTSPITIFGGGKSGSTILAYNTPSSLPNTAISVLNVSATNATGGINDVIIRPMSTSTISNPIFIGSDTTFNAASGVVGTWAGLITGSSTLYVSSGTLVPTGTSNTFNGPVGVAGTNAVLKLTTGVLSPSLINVSAGTLAATGTLSAPLYLRGGTLFPGYRSTTPQTLTLAAPMNSSSASFVDINLTSLSGTIGTSDQLIFNSATNFLGGTLNILNPNNIALGVGDTFQIFNFNGNTPTGTFFTPPILPTLGAGQAWNVSTLYQANGSTPAGTISIVAGITVPDAWNASSGTWESASNWSVTGTAPGGYGTTEIFGDVTGVTGPTTVTLTAPEIAGNLVFNSSAGINYTLQGSNLTMYETNSIPAAINISAGTQSINSNVSFGTVGLNINTGTGSVNFGGNVSGAGPMAIIGTASFSGPLASGATSITGMATFTGPLALGAVTAATGTTLNFNSAGTQSVATLSLGTAATMNLIGGTLNTSGAVSTTAGSFLNVSAGTTFNPNSLSMSGGYAIVSGTMRVASSASITGASFIITPGGTANFTSGASLGSGAFLNDLGSFNSGNSSVTVGSGASVGVATGAKWVGSLAISQGGTATFAGQTSGSAINQLFMPSLTVGGNQYVPTPSGLLTLGISSSSANRTLLYVGSSSDPFQSFGNGSGGIDAGNGDIVMAGYQSAYWLDNVLFPILQVGYNNGAWNGSPNTSGFIYSSAAANDPAHLHALGIAWNDTTMNTTGSFSGTMLYPNFDNWGSSPYNSSSNTITSSTLLIKYTYYGDANLDGQVDSVDYTLIDNGYLSQLTGWYNGDFNYDGVVNGSDYTLIDNAFNMQGAQIQNQVASSTAQFAVASAVPEPASLGVIGIGAVGLLSRRRRRR